MSAKNRMSAKEYNELINGKEKKTKYRNKHTKVDGITFHSRKEADYYCLLKLRLRAGEIKGFCMQPKFLLKEETDKDKKETYSADFIVFNLDGTYSIEDVKGYENREFVLKKRIFEDKFDLKLKLIK